MKKVPKNRDVLICNDIISKMRSLLIENKDLSYKEIRKQCNDHFRIMYNEDSYSTYRILVNDYTIDMAFAQYISELPNFRELLLSGPAIKSNTETVVSKPQKSETIMNESTEQNVIKGFKHFIRTEKTLPATVSKMVSSGLKAKALPEGFTEADAYEVLAKFFFDDLLKVKMNFKQYILDNVSKLKQQDIADIISALEEIQNA